MEVGRGGIGNSGRVERKTQMGRMGLRVCCWEGRRRREIRGNRIKLKQRFVKVGRLGLAEGARR